MTNLFTALRVSGSALQAAGQAQAATASNVANVNTDGYRALDRYYVARSGRVELMISESAAPAVPEGSNVNLTREMVNEITDSLLYQANSNVIKANDWLLGTILDAYH